MQEDHLYKTLRNRLTKYRAPNNELLEALVPLINGRAYDTKQNLLITGDIQRRAVLLHQGAAVAYDRHPFSNSKHHTGSRT
ncbi:hypothetical protein SAMN05660841_03244 [Sphingobacterium nematocida]|uniref:Uncharacterized protein n=2 Tax=Sphingobacterium nematocida TaxID=1513896 RepID=A0A1T5FH27_9SPHI|nr:hypothetical protein SAMN05660841_03244 [Sphingobacterium nematocida]